MIPDRVFRLRLRRCHLAVVMLAAAFVPDASAQGARTARDCETIEQAHAFNLCLASLAPARARPTAGKALPEEATRAGKGRARRGRELQSAGIYRPMGRSSPFLSLGGPRW
jgi:hypothetical protein